MNDNMNIFAFTSKSTDGLLNRLINEVVVSANGKAVHAIAQWDTGATNTCISHEVKTALSLSDTGKILLSTPTGTGEAGTYLASITLPNGVIINGIKVYGSEIGKQGIGVLIGMDIISLGDFAVSNYNGKTVFTFRYPSQTTTDYVQETNAHKG